MVVKVVLVIVILTSILLSYKLTEVPPGINSDEAEIGYNAALISQSWHDSNGRLLPVFVLASDGKDWHQPITIYSTVLAFKLFGISYEALRAVSVIFAVLSGGLVYYLAHKIGGLRLALFTSLIFLTTPIILIQSHLALENISLLPVVIIWLFSLYQFTVNKNPKYLLLAGVMLGLSFYSYKGMKLVVPIWFLISWLYLILDSHSSHLPSAKAKIISYYYLSGLLPFMLIIPLLEYKYHTAILEPNQFQLSSVYHYFELYLSTFDFSFLYLKGDTLAVHSTGQHGVLLLATLPLFLVGAYLAVKHKGMLLLWLILFLTATILFPWSGTLHRGSRLLMLIPLYALICSSALIYLYQQPGKIKLLALILIALILVNFIDFANYYFYKYPLTSETRNYFPHRQHNSYKRLATEAKTRGLTPIIDEVIFGLTHTKFFELNYFDQPLLKIKGGDPLPANSIFMTDLESVPGMKQLDSNLGLHRIFVPL